MEYLELLPWSVGNTSQHRVRTEVCTLDPILSERTESESEPRALSGPFIYKTRAVWFHGFARDLNVKHEIKTLS